LSSNFRRTRYGNVPKYLWQYVAHLSRCLNISCKTIDSLLRVLVFGTRMYTSDCCLVERSRNILIRGDRLVESLGLFHSGKLILHLVLFIISDIRRLVFCKRNASLFVILPLRSKTWA
jgi:hypothetical protein